MNARIRKKQQKLGMQAELRRNINELMSLRKEAADIDMQIAEAKRTLKKRKSTLAQLKAQIAKTYNLSQNLAEIKSGKVKLMPVITYDDETARRVEVGAMIKKYHDYVDKGWIKPRAFVDNYEQATWMRNEVLSQPEVEDALSQADKWEALRKENAAKKFAEDMEMWKNFEF